jgi:phosphoribosyl-ATP pyrophosphohydrolase/phosphoribosyl-AMP cyclohydrolase
MRDRSAPLTTSDMASLDWEKGFGLIPAIVQDSTTARILMLGYMNREALEETLRQGRATFFSRTRQQLWRKGDTSGNFLDVCSVHMDCDRDALLVIAEPQGPTCHLGRPSCFAGAAAGTANWLAELSAIVDDRAMADPASSYTARLLSDGLLGIAQKVGEEGLELALAGAADSKQRCIEESADLIYHLAVLMKAREFDWQDVAAELDRRRQPTPSQDEAMILKPALPARTGQFTENR